MIVELFGLPGAGKSYICEKIEKEFGYNNILLFYKEKFLGKVLFHLYISFCLLVRSNKKIFLNLKEIIGNDYSDNIISNNNKIDMYIKYILFVYNIEKRNKDRLIIIDEGIVHYCMVLYSEFIIPMHKTKKILDYFDSLNKNNKVVLGINTDKKVVIERIKKRNRKRTAMDFLDDKKLDKLLSLYQDFINTVKDDYIIGNENEIIKIVGDLK